MKRNFSNQKTKGFTLLELLIVVAIIGVLSVALVMVLNPSEMLKKSRDAQRISDLTALKKAIEIYKTNIPSAKLAGANNTG
ncbi:MAG: prepilin-type N-terminal cleavage/methylation domain-containing protein, partial [bacterium]